MEWLIRNLFEAWVAVYGALPSWEQWIYETAVSTIGVTMGVMVAGLPVALFVVARWWELRNALFPKHISFNLYTIAKLNGEEKVLCLSLVDVGLMDLVLGNSVLGKRILRAAKSATNEDQFLHLPNGMMELFIARLRSIVSHIYAGDEVDPTAFCTLVLAAIYDPSPEFESRNVRVVVVHRRVLERFADPSYAGRLIERDPCCAKKVNRLRMLYEKHSTGSPEVGYVIVPVENRGKRVRRHGDGCKIAA